MGPSSLPPDDPRFPAGPAPWIGPVAIASPLVVEAIAIASLFVPGGVGWFFGLLFLGVPLAYLVAAAVLATEGVWRYAAIAGALAPGSAVLNGLLLLSICQYAIANNHGGTLP